MKQDIKIVICLVMIGLIVWANTGCSKQYVCVTEQTIVGSPVTAFNRTTLLHRFTIYGQEEDRKAAEKIIKLKGRYTEDIIIKTKCE